MAPVLDVSALLAHLRDEPGADVVGEAIASGAVISTVNLAEVFSRVADRGGDPAKLALNSLKADYSMARSPSSRSRPLTQSTRHGYDR